MKVISRNKVAHLLYHVVDGFSASHQGLVKLKQDGIITVDEFQKLVDQNVNRLQTKISEWRAAEKIACILFACLFCIIQILDDGSDMVRRRRRSRRRKQETEIVG